jgi:hypothetical protein
MSFWKARADAQDRYRRELYAGVIIGVHSNGTYDVALPGLPEPVYGVLNGSEIAFQEGNRVIIQRAGDRHTWQIHASMGRVAPGTRAVNPDAVLDVPPLVYWDGLARADSDETTIAGYVDAHTWPLSALEQSGAADGQVPCWSAAAQAWVPGASTGGGGGVDVAALEGLAAATLASVIGHESPMVITPAGVGSWMMGDAYAVHPTQCRGAHIYDHTAIHALRQGAFHRTVTTLAYWKMDESVAWEPALDASLRNNDLMACGFDESILSNFYMARQMNGAWSYGQANSLPTLNLDQLSLHAWVKPTTLGNTMIFYQAGTGSLEFCENGTRLRCYLVSTSQGTVYAEATVDPQALCDGAWHYLAAVYDGSSIQLYLDGAAVGAPAALSGGLTAPATSNCYVGVHAPTWTGWSRYFHGAIQEICIASRPYSATEIAQIWAGRTLHQAVIGPVTAPQPWRHVMVGYLAENEATLTDFAVSGDDGVTWIPVVPWQWATAETASESWLVRATVYGLTDVTRLGLIGMA